MNIHLKNNLTSMLSIGGIVTMAPSSEQLVSLASYRPEIQGRLIAALRGAVMAKLVTVLAPDKFELPVVTGIDTPQGAPGAVKPDVVRVHVANTAETTAAVAANTTETTTTTPAKAAETVVPTAAKTGEVPAPPIIKVDPAVAGSDTTGIIAADPEGDDIPVVVPDADDNPLASL